MYSCRYQSSVIDRHQGTGKPPCLILVGKVTSAYPKNVPNEFIEPPSASGLRNICRHMTILMFAGAAPRSG